MTTEAETFGESGSLLTKENLALVQEQESAETRNEDEKSSDLSKIGSNHPEDLNLSAYCMSSDAETEKMDAESLNQHNADHPVLSELAGEIGSSTENDAIKEGTQQTATQNKSAADDVEKLKDQTADAQEETGAVEQTLEPPSEQAVEAFVERAVNVSPEEVSKASAEQELEASAEKALLEEQLPPAEEKILVESTSSTAADVTVEASGQVPTSVPVEKIEEAGATTMEAGASEALVPSIPAATSTKTEEPVATAPAEEPLVVGALPTESLAPLISTPKRPLEEEIDVETQFKKPRPPASELKNDDDDNNDESNDADEDEDEVEEEYQDKQEPVTGSSSVKIAAKNHAVNADTEFSSSMKQENQRLSALQEITEIEHQFAELRQRLYENKLAKLQTETQMCLEGSHPALQSYYQKIDSVRDYKLRRAYQRQKYELECIDKETKATRCFIHQDFYRKVADLKHDLLVSTTQKWYDINKERREMDVAVPDVGYHVPVKIDGKTLSCITGYAAPAQLKREGEPLPEDLECEGIEFRFKNNPVDKLEVIVDRMRFNNELSDLEGLRRYFQGFPGAPSLGGLKESEIYEDLQSARARGGAGTM